MDCFRALKVDFTLAHMGMYLARDGVRQPGFRQHLELLRHGDRRAYVKLTGAYRISTAPDFGDITPMAHALIEAAPDRVIWGSDYPHLSFADRVGSVALFNLLSVWATDDATRRAILVDNPRRFYGFS
jgi:predicted TIM-barrel fold metal-dependent hydrolase